MSIYYQDDHVVLYHGDCIETMRTMPEGSVDSIVTDPPYGLGFMGKKWDALPPGEDWAQECLRVLKPGGHLLAFGGTRTWHRLAVAIEDAGFEMRDSLAWLYGSGFPKHRAGLKPAFEPVVMARKPFKGSLAANEAIHGTGALNIDGCRIGTEERMNPSDFIASGSGNYIGGPRDRHRPATTVSGRWPANVLLDEHMAGVLDEQVPVARSSGHVNRSDSKNGDDGIQFISGTPHAIPGVNTYNDKGGASRFFKVAEADEHGAISPYFPREFDLDAPFKYCAKAPKSERPVVDGVAHPTVKPLALMRWLIRLVTPPGGTVLDPFAGSGTTIEAALMEGCNVIGIEREAEYLPLIEARIARVKRLSQEVFDFEVTA